MPDDAAQGQRMNSYPAIIPYLTVGDAAGLIVFLEAAFGATSRFVMPGEGGKIQHAEIGLGEGMIMLSDAAPEHGGHLDLCHYVADTDAMFARAIAAGAKQIAAPETKPYGDRVAGIEDPAGNTWWICSRLT